MRTKNLEEWRQRVLDRDNYTCQKCGKREGHVLAHHIKDKKIYPTLATETNNGLALCTRCHREVPVQLYLFDYIPDEKDGYGRSSPPKKGGWYYPKRVLSLSKTTI